MTNRCGAHRSNRLLVYGVFDIFRSSRDQIRRFLLGAATALA
jgi:hypothetical protein